MPEPFAIPGASLAGWHAKQRPRPGGRAARRCGPPASGLQRPPGRPVNLAGGDRHGGVSSGMRVMPFASAADALIGELGTEVGRRAAEALNRAMRQQAVEII